MGFNHNQSYRWVGQPKQFPGQQLDWNTSHATIEPSNHKANLSDLRFKLIQTLIQKCRPDLQNSWGQ